MSKKIKTKKGDSITLDKLTRIVKGGFDHVDSTISEFRGEFRDFKHETNKNIFNIDSKLESLDKRLKRVEEALEPIIMSYGVFSREIRSIYSRLEHLERKVASK